MPTFSRSRRSHCAAREKIGATTQPRPQRMNNPTSKDPVDMTAELM
jgi:hypothetical protein